MRNISMSMSAAPRTLLQSLVPQSSRSPSVRMFISCRSVSASNAGLPPHATARSRDKSWYASEMGMASGLSLQNNTIVKQLAVINHASQCSRLPYGCVLRDSMARRQAGFGAALGVVGPLLNHARCIPASNTQASDSPSRK